MMQRVHDNEELSSFKQVITTSAAEAGLQLKAYGRSIQDVVRVLQIKMDEFLDAISAWSDLNQPCKHEQTGNAKIKFWILVLSPYSFTYTINSVPKDAPPVRMIETDYEYFLSVNTEMKSNMCNHSVQNAVKRECSFGRRSNIVRIYVMLDSDKSALTLTKIFRCACKKEFRLKDVVYTALDFERCFHYISRESTPEECRVGGNKLFMMQNALADVGQKQRVAFEKTLKHCEHYTRMCRTCGRYGMFLNRCGGCRCAWYCDEACQMKDWKEGGHRQWCAYRQKLSLVENIKKLADAPAAAAASSAKKKNDCSHCFYGKKK